MMNRVFVGTDLRQPLAFSVLSHSIHATAKKPVQVIPLIKPQLPITRTGLTDFTFSRYLVPWLCDFKGRALFMDGDMIVLEDINNLFDWYDSHYDTESRPAVSVVTDQAEFEWNSLMMFSNKDCLHLTPDFINNLDNSPQELKRWATPLGVLPRAWNVMVKASDPHEPPEDAKVLHFTEGLPCFFETQDTPGAYLWHAMKREMNYTVNWKALMGNSIHAGPVIRRLLKAYEN